MPEEPLSRARALLAVLYTPLQGRAELQGAVSKKPPQSKRRRWGQVQPHATPDHSSPEWPSPRGWAARVSEHPWSESGKRHSPEPFAHPAYLQEAFLAHLGDAFIGNSGDLVHAELRVGGTQGRAA